MTKTAPARPPRTAVLTQGKKMRRRSALGAGGMLALIALGLLVLVAIFAPVLAPHDPLLQDLAAADAAPDYQFLTAGAHPLGTDSLGRDNFSRVIWGAQTPMLVGTLAVIGSGLIGIVLGVTAGYVGGVVDQILSRLADIQLAIPSILLALLILAFGGRGLTTLIIVIAVTGWPSYFRICRSAVLSLRRRAYVEAAVISNASAAYIIFTHLIRAIGPLAVVAATLDLSRAVLLEAGLSFLGLGVQPPTPDWGLMVADGQSQIIQGVWWVAVFPGLGLVLLVLSTNVLGDRLSDLMAPGSNLRGRRL